MQTNKIENPEEQKLIWKDLLINNKELQEYFSQFRQDSVDSFINNYVESKLHWYNYGEMFAAAISGDDTKWIDLAHVQLEIIQQKKLFDAQCLWRANQLVINDIMICHDFTMWEDYILDCGFIEPVTKDDIDLYAKYLTSLNDADDPFEYWGNMQEYEILKDAYNDDEDSTFPRWYEYHNLVTGNNMLMQLQDSRGDSEDFYFKLYFDDKNNREKENEKPDIKKDDRPFLFSHNDDDDIVEKIVIKYEDINTKYLYKAYTEGRKKRHRYDDCLEEEIELLLNLEEDVQITQGLNWRDATRIAARNYKCNKVIESLPEALEQYNLKKQLGISFYEDTIDYEDEMRKIFMDQILTGRRLNNEPEDFNF